MKLRKILRQGAFALAPLVAVIGNAGAASLILFDPDGNGPIQPLSVSAFDWSNGNALVTSAPGGGGAIPLGVANTKPVQTYVHGALRGLLNPVGDPHPDPAGLNSTFELTYVGGTGEAVTTNFNGSIATFAFDGTAGQSNFFYLYHDDLTDGSGSKGASLSGLGYRDGTQILRGVVVEINGNFGTDFSTGVLDQFGTDNWGGTLTVRGQGSQSIAVMVQYADPDFFKAGVAPGTILQFTTQQNVPYLETNPSQNFETEVGVDAATVGAVNGASGPEMVLQTDASNNFEFIPTLSACRVTGGGNDTAGINALEGGWDGTYAADRLSPSVLLKPKGKAAKSSTVTDYYDYSFGGQAGANTALPPQPKGQWEHNNHSSPSGLSFAFHGGRNAPAGTQIDEIRCTDPGWCEQARPAPNKQIDFVGVGTFSNISNNTFTASDGVIFDGIDEVIPEPKGQRPNQAVPTYHWFQVHIEDLGEPGSENPNTPIPGATCPPAGSGNNPFADPPVTDNIADCGCADFYRITIYKGVQPAVDADGKVILDANGDVPGLNKTDKIYEVYGYINGGNFQIHPLTGFDLK